VICAHHLRESRTERGAEESGGNHRGALRTVRRARRFDKRGESAAAAICPLHGTLAPFDQQPGLTDKKIVAVVGATGAQGGGLVCAILNDAQGPFAARAITRNPGSEQGKALARLGAEVVAGDLDDPESIKKAFAGAHGAYCVTFF